MKLIKDRKNWRCNTKKWWKLRMKVKRLDFKTEKKTSFESINFSSKITERDQMITFTDMIKTLNKILLGIRIQGFI
jgi:hypothetical protein